MDTEIVNSHILPRENYNWPDLLSKTVEDLSQIARTEVQLLEATVKQLIEAQTDKLIGVVFLLVALAYGSLFLSAGIVLLVHLWLAWWLAFVITGAAIVVAGFFFQITMSVVARRKETRSKA
jgi:hypothetical protein